MVKRYPHDCLLICSEMLQNDDGDLETSLIAKLPLKCRVEPSSVNFAVTDKGVERRVSEIIFTPLFERELIDGEVEIRYFNKTHKVLGVQIHQNYVEIWV